ncbi:MAG: hypothetical protein HFJ45_01370 [Clostridia bacterium]|nr:hypothetical protein [Clostridia bacterium]
MKYFLRLPVITRWMAGIILGAFLLNIIFDIIGIIRYRKSPKFQEFLDFYLKLLGINFYFFVAIIFILIIAIAIMNTRFAKIGIIITNFLLVCFYFVLGVAFVLYRSDKNSLKAPPD